MNETKFVLLIVEGISDEALIGEYLVDLFKIKFKDMNIKFRVTDGDILTKRPMSKSGKTIVECIFKEYLNTSSLKKNDFIQIIQVCDVDGSYFPNSNIEKVGDFDEGCYPKYRYSLEKNKIFICDKIGDKVLKSWNMKKNRQDELICTSLILGIPYSIYYNSFFLEHVLYDRIDIKNEEKESLIDSYIDKNNLTDFLTLLKQKAISSDYNESWEKLKRTEFPLYQSYSNMLLMFDKLEKLFFDQTDINNNSSEKT